jgi:Cu2+-exporting ATPase
MTSPDRCFHCDGSLPTENSYLLEVNDVSHCFCSDVCRSIARQIEEAGLSDFYRFREAPTGSASARDVEPRRWAGYDRPALQREFVNAGPDGTRSAQLLIQGVRCAACTWLIENAMGRVAGVQSVSVDPVTTRAQLRWDPQRVALSELLARLARLGYTPAPYTEDHADRAASLERRQALKRLVVAGLGMMQVVSFAVALYAGAFQTMDAEIRQFLRLISLLVATPVVFYSGAPFFTRAASGIRAGSLGMDVPVALAIGGAYSASVWNTFVGAGEVYFDSATMFVFFLSAARFLEMAGRHRALSLTGTLARQLPKVATRLVDGRLEEVGTMELECGDLVLVQPGQALPADGFLADGTARIDESLLTGESAAVVKERGDRLLAGSINLTRAVRLRVERVGAGTVMAQIGRLVTEARERKPKLVELADRIASYFVAGVLLAALGVGIFWWSTAPERAFEVVLAVLVVTCPCALALATPAAFTVATSALARRGFMIRRSGALQTLANVTDVVFDKTGTLTRHDAGIREVVTADCLSRADALGIAAALESQSEHPLARAFPVPADAGRARDVRAVPGEGLEGRVDGHVYRIGTRNFALSLGASDGAAVTAGDAAQRFVYLGNHKGLLARFEIDEVLRPGAAAAVRVLIARGLRPHLASGDQQSSVAALAALLGIDHWQARQRPADKLALIRGMQSAGRVVAMVGDGINDSPVLAGADVSVAMGSGTTLAQHSADCVLLAQALDPLTGAFDAAHRTMAVVRQNLIWAVCYNLVALPLAASGALAPWMAALGMSASSLLVTMNALRLGRRRPPAAGAEPAPGCCESVVKLAS